MHFTEVSERVKNARKASRCLERWICSCWLVPWMLILWWTSKAPPSMFISGRVFGKWNDDLCPSYSGSSLRFFPRAFEHCRGWEAAGEMPCGGFYCCLFCCPKKDENKETSFGLRAFNSATSRNTISAEVWWMMLQKKEALSNLKGQDWTNLRSENELKTL